MATSSGNSSGSPKISNNSSSEEELQVVILDQRKRKRMESNRESARRSRMRKQKYLNDLMSQVTQLMNENDQLLKSINITTHKFLQVESENSVLRAQMMELTQRLDSSNEILNYINHASDGAFGISDHEICGIIGVDDFMNPIMNNNMMYFNQPITVSSDLLNCEY